MSSTKVPQSRIEGLQESLAEKAVKTEVEAALSLKQDKQDDNLKTTSKTVVGAINELYSDKAFVTDLTHVPAGLTHSISGKNLVIAPGHVLNYAGKEVLKPTENTVQAISTVTQGLKDKIILGDTAERIDILDYTTLSSEFSSQGRIIPVDSLGGYDNFASGTVNSKGSGFDNAVAMFYEGTATSKSTGFLFDQKKELGEYVVTLAADVPITDARIAFYKLTGTTEKEDGTYDYAFELVSQSIVTATSPNVKVSLTGIASSEFQMIAISVNTDYARYCRLYKVAVAATYNTFLCKYGQGWVIRMALSEQALVDANYTNFAKVGQVTIGDGPVACYPEKDISSAYADGDLKQQEPSYSNFYTRKEMDTLISDLDRAKADRKDTLAGYGITDAYTKKATDNLLAAKQDKLTPGTNIKITYDETTDETTISTTFDATYSKTEVDEKFAQKATDLEGYGITNAYNKSEVNNLVNSKQDANDTALTTEAKSIVPAINEINALAIAPLGEIVAALPETGDNKKIYFVLNSASESEIDKYNEYIYVNNAWELIGGGSSAGSGSAKPDNITTISNVDESITAIGVKTKSDTIKYDWVGTMAEWEAGRKAATIPDDWFCYIIDDGTPVVNATDAKTYASLEYVITSISQAVDPVQTELTEYKTSTNTTIASLQNADAALEARVTALEKAFGDTVDQINGEVI